MNTDPAATTRTALHLISDAIRPLVEGSTFELATLVNVAMNGWSDADAPAAALGEHFSRMALTGPDRERAAAIQGAIRAPARLTAPVARATSLVRGAPCPCPRCSHVAIRP